MTLCTIVNAVLAACLVATIATSLVLLSANRRLSGALAGLMRSDAELQTAHDELRAAHLRETAAQHGLIAEQRGLITAQRAMLATFGVRQIEVRRVH